jgi:hypothetical protein
MGKQFGTEIRISGLKEFRTALKGAEAAAPKELKTELSAAGDLVVNETQRRLRSGLKNPKGKLAGTVRVSAGATSSKVTEGNNSNPQAGWIDFGGTIRHHSDSWSSTRTFIKTGRFLYPSYMDKKTEIQDDLEKSLEHLAEKYFG